MKRRRCRENAYAGGKSINDVSKQSASRPEENRVRGKKKGLRRWCVIVFWHGRALSYDILTSPANVVLLARWYTTTVTHHLARFPSLVLTVLSYHSLYQRPRIVVVACQFSPASQSASTRVSRRVAALFHDLPFSHIYKWFKWARSERRFTPDCQSHLTGVFRDLTASLWNVSTIVNSMKILLSGK